MINKEKILNYIKPIYEKKIEDFDILKLKFSKIIFVFFISCFLLGLILLTIFNFFPENIKQIVWITGLSIIGFGIITTILMSWIHVTYLEKKIRQKFFEINKEIYPKIVEKLNDFNCINSSGNLLIEYNNNKYELLVEKSEILINNSKKINLDNKLSDFKKNWKLSNSNYKKLSFSKKMILKATIATTETIIEDLKTIIEINKNGN